MPRAGTPKSLWGKAIHMRRMNKDTLNISTLYVLDGVGVNTKQVTVTKYGWAPARMGSMQTLINTTGKWPNIVGDEKSGLHFSCGDPECAADDGVEDMSACECRTCKAERVAEADESAGVWLHKSCAANEWAAGDGGSAFEGEVGDDFVCQKCLDAGRNDEPVARAGAGNS